ncbi:MAG: Co2+/Mg2+ efflux protein ApaG [Clostridia bacterium]|nr:Co2+/Mg2+ efflux protein ApaG [Deltaproteobacteria bacterium]
MPSPREIQIEVETFYVPERSEPQRSYYFFAYHITITNLGDEPAQLVRRHWKITDAHGRVEEVRGDGIIGQSPRLEPGESFDYTSACPMRTQFGTMEGIYTMVRDNGREFEAPIDQFMLAMPSALN